MVTEQMESPQEGQTSPETPVPLEDDEDPFARLESEGDLILSHYCDLNHPGGGAWVEYVYEFQGAVYYYSHYDDTLEGPFDSLASALRSGCAAISSASVSIDAPGHDAGDIAASLSLEHTRKGKRLTLNDEDWIVWRGKVRGSKRQLVREDEEPLD